MSSWKGQQDSVVCVKALSTLGKCISQESSILTASVGTLIPNLLMDAFNPSETGRRYAGVMLSFSWYKKPDKTFLNPHTSSLAT
jgi:hypothetical protein